MREEASAVDATSQASARAAAIARYDLLFPIDDPHLDAICRHVADYCHAPIAVISLVDETEQRFLGKAGTELRQTPRATSFCAVAIGGDDIMVVPDARADPRFADYPLVTGAPFFRFYAGIPLVTSGGGALGALCLLDHEPRDGLSESQAAFLRLMAVTVMDRLTLRQAERDGQLAARDAASALDASEWRFRTLADTMPQMVWSARPDGHSDYFNARWYAFTGLADGASEGDGWRLSLHPEDHDRTRLAWQHSVETGEPYELEYRLKRADGEYRWALTRGLPMRAENGLIIRWFGTCTDIHDHRIALEERELISQELSHRIKNIFAVISGLIGLSARTSPAVQSFAESLRDRILALGRAHDFVGTQKAGRETGTSDGRDSLQGLLREIFSPYQAQSGDRVAIRGDDFVIDDRSATPLALTFHEIVTNAAKYGALSRPEGNTLLTISRGEKQVEMHWQEHGGPAIDRVNSPGFGSRLLDLSVRRQLGGHYELNWKREGLEIDIHIPLSALNRQPD